MTATSSRIHVISEGVLASYIHDIASQRPRAEAPRPAPRTAAEEESARNPG
jgi:LytS/YehU family sensor histidine kinase